MTDTTTNTPAIKRPTVAIRDWIDPSLNPVESGKEADAVGFRYTHLPTALRLQPTFNPETDTAPDGSSFDFVNMPEPAKTMLAIFGGLTLAGNVVNTAVNGPKGDPTVNPIPLIKSRFDELINGMWADRVAGVGGVRYDKDKLAQALVDAVTASGRQAGTLDSYLAKMENKVDSKTGAVVAADAKGAISYGAFALRNAAVKDAYDRLTGGGTQLDTL